LQERRPKNPERPARISKLKTKKKIPKKKKESGVRRVLRKQLDTDPNIDRERAVGILGVLKSLLKGKCRGAKEGRAKGEGGGDIRSKRSDYQLDLIAGTGNLGKPWVGAREEELLPCRRRWTRKERVKSPRP